MQAGLCVPSAVLCCTTSPRSPFKPTPDPSDSGAEYQGFNIYHIDMEDVTRLDHARANMLTNKVNYLNEMRHLVDDLRNEDETAFYYVHRNYNLRLGKPFIDPETLNLLIHEDRVRFKVPESYS